MQTEVKFGLDQVKNQSPVWATWLFRITLYVCSLVTLGLTTLNVGRLGLSPADVNDLVQVLSFITIAVHSLTRMFGIEFKKEEYEVVV